MTYIQIISEVVEMSAEREKRQPGKNPAKDNYIPTVPIPVIIWDNERKRQKRETGEGIPLELPLHDYEEPFRDPEIKKTPEMDYNSNNPFEIGDYGRINYSR